MMEHIFTGFGFGPIQSGLFVNEAYQSSNFSRIVIVEIDQTLVEAVRANKGTYYVNVASSESIEPVKVEGIEIYNPNVEEDRERILQALSRSTEIVTSLPSVNFYDSGKNSVASLIAEGTRNRKAEAALIYTAENNNHAAEILRKIVQNKLTKPLCDKIQFLNTVIGKMSQVVTDADEIKTKKLKPIVPGIDRAFLVEEFNKIFVTKCNLGGFKPGIEVFMEKEDLLPFEEAKLYGHNAIHALLAYLGAYKDYKKMARLRSDTGMMRIARDAFINESGAALIKKYTNLGDELFTEPGYKVYAEDLLERITNPYLDDAVERNARDPVRKLGIDDRVFGTMGLCLEQGIEPENMALGAMAGIYFLLKKAEENKLPENLCFSNRHKISNAEIEKILGWIWRADDGPRGPRLVKYVQDAKERLEGKVK